MGSFIEEILKSATSGKADNGGLGSIIEMATGKKGGLGEVLGQVTEGKLPGGLGEVLGQVTGTQEKSVKEKAQKPTQKEIAQEEAAIDMGGLGSILGQLGLGSGKLDLSNIGDMAKSVISVIGLAQGALGGKK